MHSSVSQIDRSLQSLLFKFKDLITSSNQIELLSYRKNLTSKVYCRNRVNSENFTLLFAPSYFDSNILLSITYGVLQSLNIVVSTQENYDVSLVEKICNFLQNSHEIYVRLDENAILICSHVEILQLMDVSAVEIVAKEVIVKSLCILFAMSGKIVKNNCDDLCLNDYGVSNFTPN